MLAPPACAACRAPLPRAGPLVCPACLRALPWLPAGLCPRCALPAHRAGRGCPARGRQFGRAWAPLAYEGVARELVVALKFAAARPLADLMAAQLAANLPRDLREGAGLIVPVPPQPARHRRRGFDPVGLLAAALARRTGRPLAAVLRRTDRAAPQRARARGPRRRHEGLALALVAPPPREVLLVDDVHTTGATLDACARVLREGGARRVAAVSYARTL
jgi:ComF family protein